MEQTNAKTQTKNTQREKNDKAQQLADLKKLRRNGVLTRQQFRRAVFDKGLQSGVKGSPMITTYEVVKVGKKKTLEVKTQQWTRI